MGLNHHIGSLQNYRPLSLPRSLSQRHRAISEALLCRPVRVFFILFFFAADVLAVLLRTPADVCRRPATGHTGRNAVAGVEAVVFLLSPPPLSCLRSFPYGQKRTTVRSLFDFPRPAGLLFLLVDESRARARSRKTSHCARLNPPPFRGFLRPRPQHQDSQQAKRRGKRRVSL